MNSTHLICGNQTLKKHCDKSIDPDVRIRCKKENGNDGETNTITLLEICRATDFVSASNFTKYSSVADPGNP